MEKGLRSLAVLGVYPLVLAGACALWWALYTQGLGADTAALLSQALTFVVVWTLEQALPHCHRWQQPQDDRATDALHLAVSMAISVAVLRFLRVFLLMLRRWFPVLVRLVFPLIPAQIARVPCFLLFLLLAHLFLPESGLVFLRQLR